QLFEEQVERTPGAIAVVGKHRQQSNKNNVPGNLHLFFTYKELNEKSNPLSYLLREKGVGPNTIVGIMAERCASFIVGIIAILKAGGAYLPIDPDYPEARKKNLLQDSHTKLLLTKQRILRETPSLSRQLPRENILYLEEKNLYRGRAANPVPLNDPGNLAYVIYTSGTTGKPKGTMVLHRNVNNLVFGLNRRIYNRYNEKLKVVLVSPFIFDASV
ncbi:MAG: AMP-binding protein, partial [bacterium]|nr:AMP-binding protein [bacterium]